MPLNFLNNGYFAGTVGIGTNAPSEKLEVQDGNIKIETTTNLDAKLILNPFSSGLGTSYQWEIVGKSSSGNYNLQIREGGTPYVTIDSSVNGNAGNVGIGTTSPGAKLEVFNSGGTVFNVLGSLGQLFSVTDNLSGEIFAVADISGVPIMSINSSGSIKFGSYSGTNQTGTPTYVLGTDATGNVVKVLGGDIPGVSGQFLPLIGGSLSGPGNLTVGGTLTVTGNSTLNGDLYLGTDADILKSGTNPFRLFTNGTLALSVSSSQTATFEGKVITTEVESTSALLLDATDDITIDAGGGDIILSDDEVIFGTISSTGGMQIRSRVDDADMFLRGVNNGAEFDALTLDMSEGGDATFAGLITATKSQNATSSFAFQNLDTTGTSVRTHLTATAGDRSIRLEAIHSDYSYVVSNNARMYFQTNDGSNNTLLLDGDNATFTGTVTSPTFLGDLNGTINTLTTAFTQANAIDNATVATTAYVNNKIQLIPAGLVFQGTWDARTNAEGGAAGDKGNPALTSGVGTTGHFYIVSNSGSVDLDGITDWVTGDWAVFVEVGATDTWQKIDNSSVLDGSGTGGSVAGWSGSGTSNTLTDAPITFSGNNSNFAGEITTTELNLPSSGKIDWANGDARIIEGEVGGYSLSFEVYNGVAALERVLLLEKSMRATFAGDVIIKTALLSNQENTTVDTGTETVAEVPTATYTAAFFDFVIKKGLNVRSGTVYACHNGDTTPLIQFTETSTQDLGDTSDVVLIVNYSSPNMRLRATVASDGWSIKSLIRGI